MDPGAQRDVTDDESGLPRGLRWRLTARFTSRSREQRLAVFMSLMQPGPDDSILDVGVTDTAWRASNFLENGYPWPERITAVALKDMPTFRTLFPSVSFVVADGRRLPFEDQSFAVGFSNAVIEHVGSRNEQRQFVSEMLRTCRRVFIATPNAGFPIDPHTILPFVHWLPTRIRYQILRWTGNSSWASERALNPLSARDLFSMFPASARPRLHRQRLFGLTSVLTVEAGRLSTDSSDD
jgi:SAM-dependent methyltransferase